jgi:alkanesulfonate monooxygenase SsuD/methylene tetrahydromethanopterin reductase-like flavin-dependent oxidoreductase (luciferase family)
MESVHVPIASCLPEALELAVMAASETCQVKCRIGWNFSAIMASLPGRELRRVWEIVGNRLIVHMIFDGTETALKGNPIAADELVANCRFLFPAPGGPQWDVEGESAEAAFLAIKRGDCLWRLPNRPNQVRADAVPVQHFGKAAGLQCSAIVRETQGEALEAAAGLFPVDNPASWITPYLWCGIAHGRERKTAAFVGSYGEVARAMHDFKKSGISQFLIREWPGLKENEGFAARTIPLIRALESGESAN